MTAKMTTPILVLDDDCFMLRLLEELLSGLGYANIACYTNGHEALYAMQADDTMPHIILLDINMPCMDGIEFVRHLTARNYQGSLILVSGEDEIMLRAILPPKARTDALHIAAVAHHRVQYLLTWNCRHIANGRILPRIHGVLGDLGIPVPIICTPEEMVNYDPETID